jgi:hypothetical protein
MRITGIQISNFRNIRDLDMQDMAGAGLAIFGPNDTGKTSLLHALRLALFGRCDLQDGRGTWAHRPVSYGSDCGCVAVHIESEATGPYSIYVDIEVGKTLTWVCCNEDGEEIADTPESMWRALGLDIDVARVACAVDRADLSATLSTMLVPRIDAEDVLANVVGHDRWLSGFLAEHGLHPLTPEDWVGVGNTAYALRTPANKAVKELEHDIEALGSPLAPKGDPAEVAAKSRAKIEACVTRRNDLERERGRAEIIGSVPSAAEVDAALAKLTALEGARDAAQTAATDAKAEAEATRRAARSAADFLGVCKAARADAERKRAEAKAQADKVASGACPTCGRKWSQELQKTHVAPITAALEQAANALAEAVDTETETARQLSDARAKEAAAERAMTEANQAHNEAIRAVNAQDATVKMLKVQAKAAPRPTRTSTEIDVDITACDAEANKAREIVEGAERFLNYAAMTERLNATRETIEDLTWCVDSFRTGRVVTRFTLDRCAPFVEAANSLLSGLGYSIELRPAGKTLGAWVFRSGTPEPTPLTECSSGCRLLCELGMRLAIAGGAPVLVDNVDVLDGENKAALRELVTSVENTVVLAGAWSPAEPPDDATMTALREAFEPLTVLWMSPAREHAEV